MAEVIVKILKAHGNEMKSLLLFNEILQLRVEYHNFIVNVQCYFPEVTFSSM